MIAGEIHLIIIAMSAEALHKNIRTLEREVARLRQRQAQRSAAYTQRGRQIKRLSRIAEEHARKLGIIEERLRDTAAELAAQKERMRATIHDMKVPVTISLLNLELAQMEDEADQAETYINGVRRELEFMLTSIGSMLELERAESGALTLKTDELDLCQLVDGVISRMAALIHDRPGLSLENLIPPDLPPCIGDRNQLTRVFDNLFSNAIKYTDTGYIRVHGQFDPKHCTLAIRLEDTGHGIESDRAATLFDFFQGDGARPDSSGVGLALVKKVIEAHNGKVWLRSEYGVGTTVYLEIPGVGGGGML